MKNYSRFFAGIFAALSILVLQGEGLARIPEPDYIIYGIAGEGAQVIRLKVDGQILVTYIMGSNPDAGSYYILRVPMDDGLYEPQLENTAVPGDEAEIYINDESDPAAIVTITEGGYSQLVHLTEVQEDCTDGVDNDGDNDIDCEDADCEGFACDDGLFCNGGDICSNGSCSSHAGDPCDPLVCNEGSEICENPPGDSDGDGMDDSFEQLIVDDDPNDDIDSILDVLPGDDYDGDGKTNLDEFLADTDPTLPDVVRIPLEAGWNWIGYFMDDVRYRAASDQPTVEFATPPASPVFTEVAGIGDILTSIEGKYIIVRGLDAQGAHIYDPSLPDFINDLTYMGPGYGYQIKMTEAAELVLSGSRLAESASMPLSAGWNWVAYWPWDVMYRSLSGQPTVDFASSPESPVFMPVDSIGEILMSIDGQYIIVRSLDAEGAHIYDPLLPDFINDLSYMGPGYGYQIKLSENAVLNYDGTVSEASLRTRRMLRTTVEQPHFSPAAVTGRFMTLWGGFNIDGKKAREDDEVAVFADEVCVGTFKVTKDGFYGALAVYGDDSATPDKDGAEPGDELTIMVWDAAKEIEYELIPAEYIGPDPLTWTNDGDVLRLDIGE